MTKTIVSKPAKHHPEKHQLSHNSEQYLENSQLQYYINNVNVLSEMFESHRIATDLG